MGGGKRVMVGIYGKGAEETTRRVILDRRVHSRVCGGGCVALEGGCKN